jgi:ADP-ribose pyrophosphatase YjhB (NUDIX family)
MTRQHTDEETKRWLDEFPKKGVNVKLVIKSDKGNVLLVKPNYKKTWQFPGGGVEAHEEPTEGLVREVGEELGMDITTEHLSLAGTAFRRDYDHLFLIYEFTDVLNEDTKLRALDDEIEGYGFVSPHEVGPLLSEYYDEFWQIYLKKLPPKDTNALTGLS